MPVQLRHCDSLGQFKRVAEDISVSWLGRRRFVTLVTSAVYKSSYLLTYLLTYLYADGILLLAPSVNTLQKILHVCKKELDWLDL